VPNSAHSSNSGSFWRIANALVLGVGVASSLVGLDLLSNPHETSLLNLGQLHALTLIFFDLGTVSQSHPQFERS
jgi:hypothetical protein